MSDVLPYIWDGDAMIPTKGFRPRADKAFTIGQLYRLEPVEERSTASHNHEFAWLREAWANLPESLADQFPTPEHLRKRALILAGFYNETIIDVGTSAGAVRVAIALKAREGFAHIVVRRGVVVMREAKSQSRRSMNKAEFQQSKTAILEAIADMIGVTPEQLSKAEAA